MAQASADVLTRGIKEESFAARRIKEAYDMRMQAIKDAAPRRDAANAKEAGKYKTYKWELSALEELSDFNPLEYISKLADAHRARCKKVK